MVSGRHGPAGVRQLAGDRSPPGEQCGDGVKPPAAGAGWCPQDWRGHWQWPVPGPGTGGMRGGCTPAPWCVWRQSPRPAAAMGFGECTHLARQHLLHGQGSAGRQSWQALAAGGGDEAAGKLGASPCPAFQSAFQAFSFFLLCLQKLLRSTKRNQRQVRECCGPTLLSPPAPVLTAIAPRPHPAPGLSMARAAPEDRGGGPSLPGCFSSSVGACSPQPEPGQLVGAFPSSSPQPVDGNPS